MRVVDVAVVVVACACGGNKDEPGPRTVVEQAFLPTLTELLAVPATTVKCTYIRGKVVVFDGPTRKLDVAHVILPAEIRAATPEEVGTIAIVGPCTRTQQDDLYQDRTSGKLVRRSYQKCSIALVDRKRGVALAPIEVNGSMPLSGPAGKDLDGGRPQQEIAELIGSLNRVTMADPGLSPVAYVQVQAPRRDITYQAKLDPQQKQLQDHISTLVAKRADFEVVPQHPNDGANMYVIVPDVVAWKKTKQGVTCHATARVNDSLELDEVKLELPAEECLRKAATELVEKIAARIAQRNAAATTVKCR